MSRFVRVTRGAPGQLDAAGLEVLRMALWEGGREVASVPCYSGAPGCQNFRTLANERRGVLEPCPEGVYRDIGPMEWAGKRGDYKAAWSAALGPVVAQIYGERAIMLHLDANRSYAPGSAGCLCPLTLAGLHVVVGWWESGVPDWLECDWGLGTVTRPGTSAAQLRRIALDAHSGRVSARENGKKIAALAAKIDHHSGKIGVVVNGLQIDPDKIRSVTLQIVMED